jgi:hypothetical protein
MADILSEDTLRLEDAARLCQTHFCTVYRWTTKGLPDQSGVRVRLEALKVGRIWLTSKQALDRFTSALTPTFDDDVPKIDIRTVSKRKKSSEKAERALQEAGL